MRSSSSIFFPAAVEFVRNAPHLREVRGGGHLVLPSAGEQGPKLNNS